MPASPGLPAPATNDELKAFIHDTFAITIPDVQVCAHHSTPWRAFCEAYFARRSVSVWEASRGFGGKTFLLAVLGMTEALTLGCDVNILGGSGEQSQRVHAAMAKLWAAPGAPRQVMVRDPSATRTRLTTGASITALTASQRSVRGPHVPRLRMDEIDEMDVDILDAALGQPMDATGPAGAVRSHVVLSSTHQHANGTFTEVLKRASEKEWGVHKWCYKESMQPHGWLSLGEVERKKADVTLAMWLNEYELQEPNPKDRAIDPDKSQRMFREELGHFAGRDGEYIQIEEPVGDARYATGADWARKQDFTVITTQRIDVRPVRVIAYEMMQRRPWPQMVQRFEDRLALYHHPRDAVGHTWKGQGFFDITGLGDVVGGYLHHDAQGVLMVGRDRSDMLSDYIKAIEDEAIVAPFIQSMRNAHVLASVDDVYGAGHLPDSIASGALTWLASGSRKGWGR